MDLKSYLEIVQISFWSIPVLAAFLLYTYFLSTLSLHSFLTEHITRVSLNASHIKNIYNTGNMTILIFFSISAIIYFLLTKLYCFFVIAILIFIYFLYLHSSLEKRLNDIISNSSPYKKECLLKYFLITVIYLFLMPIFFAYEFETNTLNLREPAIQIFMIYIYTWIILIMGQGLAFLSLNISKTYLIKTKDNIIDPSKDFFIIAQIADLVIIKSYYLEDDKYQVLYLKKDLIEYLTPAKNLSKKCTSSLF